MTAAEGPAAAVEIAQRYGMIGGEHHKQWVIDQMLRAMLGEHAYAAWRAREDNLRAAEGYVSWDDGEAP